MYILVFLNKGIGKMQRTKTQKNHTNTQQQYNAYKITIMNAVINMKSPSRTPDNKMFKINVR